MTKTEKKHLFKTEFIGLIKFQWQSRQALDRFIWRKKMAEINLLGGLPGHERKGGKFQTGYSIYSPDGISPTVLANGGGTE